MYLENCILTSISNKPRDKIKPIQFCEALIGTCRRHVIMSNIVKKSLRIQFCEALIGICRRHIMMSDFNTKNLSDRYSADTLIRGDEGQAYKGAGWMPWH